MTSQHAREAAASIFGYRSWAAAMEISAGGERLAIQKAAEVFARFEADTLDRVVVLIEELSKRPTTQWGEVKAAILALKGNK